MRESMISMMTQPGMIDMIASSNPQLGQMINSMPMIRQTMQNPEMMRMLLNPDMMRMMSQLNPALVSVGARQPLQGCCTAYSSEQQ
jgi:ubiquilin